MSKTVIQVENLWKEYRLGVISHHTLTRDVQSWWARVRSKEDPNSPVGNTIIKQSDDESFWALQNITFEVKQGDILGIIGRNGAGKSTLLKILSQVTAPTKGEVRFNGRIASLLEVGTGFHPELTGRENIFLNGAILGMSKADIRNKLDEIIAFAEVDMFIDTPVKRYSSGMYVRLAFAVAAHLEPEILIVDEVLAVGDATFQQKCLGKMGKVAVEGRTVLFVSHNMQAIKSLCSRGILLDDGQISVVGTAYDAVNSYISKGVKNHVNADFIATMHKIDPVDFEIISIELVNQSGELTDCLLIGEECQINFYFKIKNPANSYRFGAVFRSADGTIISSIVNISAGQSHIKGETGIIYRQSVQLRNVLAPGRYHLDVNAKTAAGQYVDVIEGLSFSVLAVSKDKLFPQGAGLVCLDTVWTEPEIVANAVESIKASMS
jgi:lipopolysaccharide transport system ATP-binding protein